MIRLFDRAREIVEDRGLLWLLSASGINVRIKRGDEHKVNKAVHCLYPSHEDSTASGVIYEDKRFTCFGCGQSDSAIDLLIKLRGDTPKETAKWIVSLVDGDTKPKKIKKHPPVLQAPKQRADKSFGLNQAALDVLAHYWQLLQDHPLCFKSVELLKSRGLPKNTVYQLGVRSTYRTLIEEIKRSHSYEASKAAGFTNDKNYLFGNNEGLLIPSWDTSFDFPLSWRFRPFNNTKVKELGMCGAGRSLPLGLKSLDGSSKLVILCEGSPDYLTLATSSKLDECNFAVVGVLGRTLPRWLINRISDKTKYPAIIDMTHQGKVATAQRIIDHWNYINLDPSKRCALIGVNPSEGCDWNDYLQQGGLDEHIDKYIEPYKRRFLEEESFPFGSKDHWKRFYSEGLEEELDIELPTILRDL